MLPKLPRRRPCSSDIEPAGVDDRRINREALNCIKLRAFARHINNALVCRFYQPDARASGKKIDSRVDQVCALVSKMVHMDGSIPAPPRWSDGATSALSVPEVMARLVRICMCHGVPYPTGYTRDVAVRIWLAHCALAVLSLYAGVAPLEGEPCNSRGINATSFRILRKSAAQALLKAARLLPATRGRVAEVELHLYLPMLVECAALDPKVLDESHQDLEMPASSGDERYPRRINAQRAAAPAANANRWAHRPTFLRVRERHHHAGTQTWEPPHSRESGASTAGEPRTDPFANLEKGGPVDVDAVTIARMLVEVRDEYSALLEQRRQLGRAFERMKRCRQPGFPCRCGTGNATDGPRDAAVAPG